MRCSARSKHTGANLGSGGSEACLSDWSFGGRFMGAVTLYDVGELQRAGPARRCDDGGGEGEIHTVPTGDRERVLGWRGGVTGPASDDGT